MIKAGVFIGVDQTGNLQKLNDAASGATRMYEWGLAQGMGSSAVLITDRNGNNVYPRLIYQAIKRIVDGPGVDQLIVYFAGHGVNINRSEHWLLTDAPVDTSAAVNVSGSVELARYCGIGHVVIISDACRVAAEGIQAQSIRGVDVFPNDGPGDKAKPVDQFFACVLGKTAAEIRDPAEAAASYSALYTSAMLDALNGLRPEALEPSDTPTDEYLYVKSTRLERYLEREVPERVRTMGLETKVNQNPDAILIAHSHWLSRIANPPSLLRRGSSRVPPPLREDLRTATRTLVRYAIQAGPAGVKAELSALRRRRIVGTDQITQGVQYIAQPFGPDHFETQCGIKVRGTRIVGFAAPELKAELLNGGGETLRIGLNQGAASVLLKFDGNIGTIVPVLAGFVASITFRDGEIVDLAYEPSANGPRWNEYVARASDIRVLRAVVASASQYTRFELDAADTGAIARKMQISKGIDPTLAIYAAYAYYDLQTVNVIKDMTQLVLDDLGVTLFDLALLSGQLIGAHVCRAANVFPFVPLLSRGWNLLNANKVRLHPALKGVERTLLESVWSLFDARGVVMLERALMSREVR